MKNNSTQVIMVLTGHSFIGWREIAARIPCSESMEIKRLMQKIRLSGSVARVSS